MTSTDCPVKSPSSPLLVFWGHPPREVKPRRFGQHSPPALDFCLEMVACGEVPTLTSSANSQTL